MRESFQENTFTGLLSQKPDCGSTYTLKCAYFVPGISGTIHILNILIFTTISRVGTMMISTFIQEKVKHRIIK